MVIRIRDARRCSGSRDFRNVERSMALVVAGYDQPAYGVAGALEESALAHGVVSRVFSGQGRHDRFGHVVLNAAVREGMPVVSAVACCTLPERWLGILRLRNSREPRHQQEIRVVERVLRRQPEFLLETQRRKIGICANGAVVWDNSQDSLGLFAILGVGIIRIIWIIGIGGLGLGCWRGR